MTNFDCFNGDADGICALTQLRLADPKPAELITGVKRDIQLLKRVSANPQSQVTVLDVSLDKNRDDLARILAEGADVFYCDHHFSGEVPEHSNLSVNINTSADVCTSLLINKHLDGAYLDWAVTGTFGDNLKRSAGILAKPLGLNESKLSQLENLGIYLNYNGYGSQLEDLYFHPAELFKKTVQHDSAFGFINDDVDTFSILEGGYHNDMSLADNSKPAFQNNDVCVYQLPNQAWARRVSGVFGNDLANQNPEKAHAVITEKPGGGFVVSVRAPLANKHGADEVCRQFATGGGRAAAAGINDLPIDQFDKFVSVFANFYKSV